MKVLYDWRMEDGCIVLLVVGGLIIAPIIAFALSFAQQRKAAAERQRVLGEQQHARGLEITKLYEQLGGGTQTPAVGRHIQRLLDAAPAGYHRELTLDGGWFDRVMPSLMTLLRTDLGAPLVERYFQLFTFPSSYQAKPLEFLHQVLKNVGDDEESVARFQRLSGPVLTLSSPPEAQWLYARALELVRERKGLSTSKALALYIGRHSYSAGRPDRTPTVYDEQAIANDIAARVA
jgi:hypothetical protein